MASVFGRSRVRGRVLAEFFASRGARGHVREVARRIGASPPAVAEELANLAASGILTSERIGRSLVYSVNERSPLVPELRGLVEKTIGIEGQLRNAVAGLAGMDAAYIFGSHAAGTDIAKSDIDLLIVGRPDRVELSERLAPVERSVRRDINVITKTRAELDELKAGGDRFWTRVAGGRVIQIAGQEQPL